MSVRVLREASRVELLLLLREPVTLVFTIAFPLINLLVLSGVFGDQPDSSGDVFRGMGGSTYYAPAYLALVPASVGLIAIPTQLAGYRERGVLRRMRAAGLPVTAILTAQLAVGVLVSVLAGALVAAVSLLVFEPRNPSDLLGVLVAFLVGLLVFPILGLFLGAVFPTSRAAQGVGVLVWFVMLILGGAGPPPEVLPEAMSNIGACTPLHMLIVALQDPWFGLGWNPGMLLALIGIGAVAWIVAAFRIRRD